MGETSIDEETFNEYLDEMRNHYTADKVNSEFMRFDLKMVYSTLSSTICLISTATLLPMMSLAS